MAFYIWSHALAGRSSQCFTTTLALQIELLQVMALLSLENFIGIFCTSLPTYLRTFFNGYSAFLSFRPTVCFWKMPRGVVGAPHFLPAHGLFITVHIHCPFSLEKIVLRNFATPSYNTPLTVNKLFIRATIPYDLLSGPLKCAQRLLKWLGMYRTTLYHVGHVFQRKRAMP